MDKKDMLFQVLGGLKTLINKKDLKVEAAKHGLTFKGKTFSIVFKDINKVIYFRMSESGLQIALNKESILGNLKSMVNDQVDHSIAAKRDSDCYIETTVDTLLNAIDGRMKCLDENGRPYYKPYTFMDAYKWNDMRVFGDGSTNDGALALRIIEANKEELQKITEQFRRE